MADNFDRDNPPHLPHVEDLLRVDDGLGAELAGRHQALHVVVETHDAAKVFDADDVAVGDAAGTCIAEAEEQRQGAVHQGLLPGQAQLLILCVHGEHLEEHHHTNTEE